MLTILRRAAGTIGFVLRPRRWIIGGSRGWFGRWRRPSKDHRALPGIAEAMFTPASIRPMLHRLPHPDRPPTGFQASRLEGCSDAAHSAMSRGLVACACVQKVACLT
ncbi:hypothetical protein E2C06_29480 [Dankookia rubra]|uniref:Uncharacterized protein n=1 Tax=Dankookia rubra TaxID=1442381 RepID=A0A4R5Q7W8_9PROT|nr:hypothetical protein [Dankookia rubra]TDH59022.1 hypothetical protein E2C06_29480 [Dankookia rubra]